MGKYKRPIDIFGLTLLIDMYYLKKRFSEEEKKILMKIHSSTRLPDFPHRQSSR